ncbi:exodeoxyribonuclease VII small subunit [candidate division KSB3 bacterium]|uniref:Exodeoxyribonuclease 7 small subunit n=1 Tax=candidate division KSB3 bacterium TaxID=2044937 RepID=A0A2G6KCZ3_9BACT|nr:MAG: exodeoxyribonuclease VII small subunit [candidate division KSB3 bacterium]
MKKMTFETALEHLEKAVTELESGELPLEKALETFEHGVKMSRLCTQKLEEAEKKVELLLKVTDGTPQTRLFDMNNLQD